MGSMATMPQPISTKWVEDGSRRQVIQEIGHSRFLGGPAGEPGERRAFFVGLQGGDGEAGLFSDPGQNSDVPFGPADPGGDGLGAGNPALDAVQGYVEGMVRAAAVDGGFQKLAAFQGVPQRGEGAGDRDSKSLRRVTMIFRHD